MVAPKRGRERFIGCSMVLASGEAGGGDAAAPPPRSIVGVPTPQDQGGSTDLGGLLCCAPPSSAAGRALDLVVGNSKGGADADPGSHTEALEDVGHVALDRLL